MECRRSSVEDLVIGESMKKLNLQNFYKGKRVLVTGHTGFKGAWLSQILLSFGAKVSGLSLEPNTEPNLFTALGLREKIDHNIGDIRDLEQVDQVVKKFQPDIIFHLAAQPLVRDSYDDPRYTYETNVMGTVNVLEIIRKYETKAAVIITTDKVYKNFEKDISYSEDDQLGGHDPYSNSKACADLVVDSYIKSFFDLERHHKTHHSLIASARSGNVIGGGDWAKDRLLPDAMKAFLANNVDIVIRKPNAVRPWQHVFEPLYGYLLVGRNLYEENLTAVGSWNFGPRDEDMKRVVDVLDLVIGHFKKGKYVVTEDENKHEATLLKLNNTKAKVKLGWTPRYDLQTAVTETCKWYDAFYRGDEMRAFSNAQISKFFKEL